MSVKELLPVVQALTRVDKLRLLQFLVEQLAREEGVTLLEEIVYPVWTPHNALTAADVLLTALKEDQAKYEG